MRDSREDLFQIIDSIGIVHCSSYVRTFVPESTPSKNLNDELIL